MMRGILALVLVGFLGMAQTVAAKSDQPLGDTTAEARAVALGAELRCVVCQSESINDSQADMARDMRHLVRDKIAAGWSDDKIRDYIRARYGDFILLRPPFQANTWLLWLSPVVFLGAAGGGLFIYFRRREKI